MNKIHLNKMNNLLCHKIILIRENVYKSSHVCNFLIQNDCSEKCSKGTEDTLGIKQYSKICGM